MPRPKTKTAAGANLGFETKLVAMADALRNNMGAAEDTPVVLGLTFSRHVADTCESQHRGADSILANPPFNVSDWRGELVRQDKRWQYDVPPADNANLTWAQHIVDDLAPTGPAGRGLATHGISAP
ncbi:MAG: N-6 DNA methylase [Candidatus Rokubacteria bacterium]|nr:N-6 DNA methylase [Candidatus Rokubacteria bacterium]